VTDDRAFVETSVHIALRNHRDKKEVEEALRDFSQLITSTYVKMEFRRALIGDLLYVYNVLNQEGHVGELLFRIQGLSRQGHKQATSLLNLAQFFCDEGESEVEGELAEVIRARLLDWCRDRLRQWWRRFGVGMGLLDETGCVFAPAELPMNGDVPAGMPRCNKHGVECRLPELFDKKGQSFVHLIEALEAGSHSDDKQSRLLELLRIAVADPRRAAEQSICWGMGDAVIAVSSGDARIILTRDRHFDPLAPALGKTAIRL